MAPPTSSASTRGSRFSMTLILSETFAPPRTATKGFSGELAAAVRESRSPLQQEARGALLDEGHHAGRRGVGAVRGAEGVVDVDVASSASSRAKPSSLASSSVWKRRFSSSSTCPSFSSFTSLRTPSPTQSSASSDLGLAEQLGELLAAGSSDSAGSGFPLGRPRCEATMTWRALLQQRVGWAAPRGCACRRSPGARRRAAR